MIGYIYITYNKINGKIYIGQHKSNIHDKKYYGSGKYLRKAIEKYGVENFENHIIEWCENKNVLDEKEKYWINKYQSFRKNDSGYNQSAGGNFGNTLIGMPDNEKEIYRKNMSNTLSGENNPMYGVNWQDFADEQTIINHKKNISKSLKKKHEDPIYKKKISLASKRVWENNEYREKMSKKSSRQIHMYDENKKYIGTFRNIFYAITFLNITTDKTLLKRIKNNEMYKGYYWKREEVKGVSTIENIIKIIEVE